MERTALSYINIGLQQLWVNEEATAAVEYAVLISVTVSLLAAGMYFYSTALKTLYEDLGGRLF
jgi:Flp pilus assembly pilin Flp